MAKKKLNHDDIEKREALKKIMEGPLFKEAMADVKLDIAEEILRSNDPQVREQLYWEAHNLQRIQSKLESYVTDLLFLKQRTAEEE